MFSGIFSGNGKNRVSFEVGSRNAECGIEKKWEVGIERSGKWECGMRNRKEVGSRKIEV